MPLFLAVLLTATGCGTTHQPVTYYSLLGTTDIQPIAGERHEQLALSIGPVVIPDLLKQSRIAIGGEGGRYQLSESHRWSGEIDREFAQAVAEQLAGRLGTEKVGVFPGDQYLEPTRRVQVDVIVMGGELGKEAILAVRWALVDPQCNIAPMVKRSDFREATSGAGYAAWVAAQQRNIARLGEEIAGVVKETVNP